MGFAAGTRTPALFAAVGLFKAKRELDFFI